MVGTAIVRALPASYAGATRGVLLDPEQAGPIDVARARRQHATYIDALARAGLRVVVIPEDPASPDSCFVEDVAVVVGGRALLCRTGHEGRRGEAAPVGEALRALGLEVRTMTAGSLEGGDVLLLGDRLYVGLSARSDPEGASALARCFPDRTVVPVPLPPDVLHLKCVCSSPAPGLVLLAEGALDPALFAAEVLSVPRDEAYAANAVGWGGRVLLPSGHPATAALLRRRGLAVDCLDVSEIRKGDGSLTCLSLVVG